MKTHMLVPMHKVHALVGEVFDVTFQLGRRGSPICFVSGIVGLPDATWPGKPHLGWSYKVRVLGVNTRGAKSYCLVAPLVEGDLALDSSLNNPSGATSPTISSSPADEFYFRLDEIPENSVLVRFKKLGGKILGNYEGRSIDPNCDEWGIARQPRVFERWRVEIIPKKGKRADHARAVEGPLKGKRIK